MRLCTNCRWCVADFSSRAHTCTNPQVAVSPVDGHSRPVACDVARQGACGPEGRLFENKPIAYPDPPEPLPPPAAA